MFVWTGVFDALALNCYNCIGEQTARCNDPFDSENAIGLTASSKGGWCGVRLD